MLIACKIATFFSARDAQWGCHSSPLHSNYELHYSARFVDLLRSSVGDRAEREIETFV